MKNTELNWFVLTTVRPPRSVPRFCSLQVLHAQNLSYVSDVGGELAAARDRVHETGSTSKHAWIYDESHLRFTPNTLQTSTHQHGST